MNYCKKCARIIDTDSNVCPYCGNSDTEFEELLNKEKAPEASREEETNNQIEEPNAEPEVYSPPEVYVKPDEHNENRSNDIYEVPQGETPSWNRPVYDAARDFTPEKEMDAALKVMVTVITVLFPFVGLILAIIFMKSSSESYRSTGKLLLIISVVELGLTIICCCGFFALMIAAA